MERARRRRHKDAGPPAPRACIGTTSRGAGRGALWAETAVDAAATAVPKWRRRGKRWQLANGVAPPAGILANQNVRQTLRLPSGLEFVCAGGVGRWDKWRAALLHFSFHCAYWLVPPRHTTRSSAYSMDDNIASTACKTKTCSAHATTASGHCDTHAATASKRRARPTAAAKGEPPAKKPRTKSALPSTVDAMPTATIELAGDAASTQKCSYHDCPNRAKVVQTYGVFCNRHAVVFPCGFPGCRDKAPTNGTRCAKHAEQGTAMLDEALSVRSQSIPVCRTKGCFKNDQGRGYCRGHEKLMMATGQLPHAINKRRLNSAYTMCCFPGCNKHSQRNHLCRIHGNELIKQAQHMVDSKATTQTFEDVLAALQKELRRCTHVDCEKNAQRDRLCTTHFHLRGQAEKGMDPKGGGGGLTCPDAKEKVLKFCSEEKCTHPVYCNWLCQQHYEQREKKGNKASHKANTGQQQMHKDSSKGVRPPKAKATDYMGLSPPLPATSAGNSMVDLLYPHKDSMYSDLSFDDAGFGKKDGDKVSYSAASSSLAAARTAAAAANAFSRQAAYGLSFEYNEPSATFLNDSSSLYTRGSSSCANPTCSREVIGKGLCEVCVGMSTHVNFSPTMHHHHSIAHPPPFDVKPSSAAGEFGWHHHHTHPSQYFYDAPGSRPEKTTPPSYYNHGGGYGYDPKAKPCNFANCRMVTKAPLCLLHASATLCTAPSCEEMVVTPGFCPLHGLHNQCAVDGCHLGINGTTNPFTCMAHETAPRCGHTQCFKFAAKGSSTACMLHQGTLEHCKLCTMYDLACPLVPSASASTVTHHLKENSGHLSNLNSSLHNKMTL
ncbi:Aste57867_21056 [Aphanomyces stellatus]|uniref:Aste57867_21056 protein n=1 Tax=Aphanomyces stellatus TaxID=120398 RepID=A0A485LH53_9STRA|nr:hypothetical protein As57867_020988 [Aphanomyces stellatus]VFT97731.1 Aste57867_21056 [Aphanomyces stellatus]